MSTLLDGYTPEQIAAATAILARQIKKAAYSKQYHEAHKEEIHMRHKQRNEDHKEEIAARNKQRYANNKEEILEQHKLYNKSNKEKIVAQHKQWYEDHRKEKAAYNKQWHEANKERVHLWHKQRYEGSKEKILQQMKQYNETHKKERKLYNESNREEIAVYSKQYKKEHPEIAKAAHHKVDAKRHSVIGSYTGKEWKAKCEEYDNRCVYCGTLSVDTPEGKLTDDHIIPIKRGGNNYIDNQVPACLECNLKKHIRTGEEFFADIDAGKESEVMTRRYIVEHPEIVAKLKEKVNV